MNKKTIQIIVIVAAFGASGLVLYNGLFSDKSSESAETPATLTVPGESVETTLITPANQATSPAEILPYGTSLDYERVLKKHKFQFNAFEYPTLDAEQEVGIAQEDLVKPKIPVESSSGAQN